MWSTSVEQASHCFRLFVSFSFTWFVYPSNIQSPTSFSFDEHSVDSWPNCSPVTWQHSSMRTQHCLSTASRCVRLFSVAVPLAQTRHGVARVHLLVSMARTGRRVCFSRRFLRDSYASFAVAGDRSALMKMFFWLYSSHDWRGLFWGQSREQPPGYT